MSERKYPHRKALAAFAAFAPAAAGLAHSSPAGGQATASGDESSDPDETGDALSRQAELYALDYDVDVAEARRTLESQDELSAALARLKELAGERFAGAWIDHKTGFRGVIRLTGPVADGGAFDAVIETSPAPIDVRTDARFSAAELAAEQLRVQDALDEVAPGASTATDPRTGSVVVYLPEDSTEAHSRGLGADPAAALQALTEAPLTVRHDLARTEAHQIYGGDHLGLGTEVSCTTGFSMWYVPPGGGDWVEAMMTAGHCNDGGGVPVSIPTYAGDFNTYDQLLAQAQDSDSDIAVYAGINQITLEPLSAEPEFYGVSQSPMNRTTAMSITERTSQTVGTFVCHQGGTTNYSCGEIVANNTTDCATAVTGGSCDPVWVRVEGENLACYFGDSGGPWFVGSSAYGLHHGGGTTGMGQGDCTYAVYTAIDKKAQVNSVIMLG